MADNVPGKLKGLQLGAFAKRAAQLEKFKPIITYWIQKIIASGLHSADEDCTAYTTDLMEKLEHAKAKNPNEDALLDDVAASAYCEQFALQTFAKGDKDMTENKATNNTVDTLLAAATFLEILTIWKKDDPEITSKTKYAKYHALRILKAIKAGEDPNLTNPAKEIHEEALSPSALDPNDPEVRSINQSASQQPPHNPYQPYVETAPNTSAQPSPALSAHKVSPSPILPSAPTGYSHNQHNDVSPISQPNSSRQGSVVSVGGGYFPRTNPPTFTAENTAPSLPTADSIDDEPTTSGIGESTLPTDSQLPQAPLVPDPSSFYQNSASPRTTSQGPPQAQSPQNPFPSPPLQNMYRSPPGVNPYAAPSPQAPQAPQAPQQPMFHPNPNPVQQQPQHYSPQPRQAFSAFQRGEVGVFPPHPAGQQHPLQPNPYAQASAPPPAQAQGPLRDDEMSIAEAQKHAKGKKNLVLEKTLAGPLNLLVKFSTLQEYGVDKPFFLENDNVDSSQRNVVFLVRGEKAKTVMAVAGTQIEHEFSVFWVPRRTMVSDQLLEGAGVLGEASVSEWPLFFVPLADDVLSLELDDAATDLYLRKDPTCIYLAAKALMLQQQKYGLFPRIIGKGDNGKRLADLLIRMRTEVTAGETSNNPGPSFLGLAPSSTVDSLVIVDREVDFPTVLLTQLTYEGLIDEVFNISANQTEVDSSVVGGATPQSSQTGSALTSMKRKIMIDPKDTLYNELGDANFAIVGNLLNKVARRLQSSTERNQLAAKTTSELRDFVAKLPGYQAEQASLKLHTSLAEEIIKYTRNETFTHSLEVQQNVMSGADPTTQHDTIFELINRSIPLPVILRLLCLESTTNAGIRPKDLEAFKRAIIQAYGPQHILTLASLEKMGLLGVRGGVGLGGTQAKPGSVTNYTPLRKSLKIWDDDVNEAEPNDISYTFSGYAPLSVRLVQSIVQKQTLANIIKPPSNPGASAQANPLAQGLRIFDDASKYVRGATFDETQTGEEKAVKARNLLNGSHNDANKTIVVFFLGGVTRAEIAALRFVGEKLKEVGGEGRGSRIVVAATNVIRGEILLEGAIEKGRFTG
ncbi:Sec1-like protein [Setomelanomma holmii]|uniref:Sec1-like protein n=1 Tax=Setomelanomma holmii TaxID=210430 RepID=A0A9P4HLP3_9PLEO|nr:Sec1-like protein [Setomelanomma holmii]